MCACVYVCIFFIYFKPIKILLSMLLVNIYYSPAYVPNGLFALRSANKHIGLTRLFLFIFCEFLTTSSLYFISILLIFVACLHFTSSINLYLLHFHSLYNLFSITFGISNFPLFLHIYFSVPFITAFSSSKLSSTEAG